MTATTARNLPAPRRLTPEQMAEATRDARQLREAIDRATAGMERTPDNVRLK